MSYADDTGHQAGKRINVDRVKIVAETHMVSQELTDLHESYVHRLNVALEEGRDSIAQELSDAYTEEALAVILGEDPARSVGRGRQARVQRPRRRHIRHAANRLRRCR